MNKKRKETNKQKRKNKENSPELQKPNVKAEVYNNKKCDWGEKKEKKKLKSFIRFHRANKIDNYNRAGGKGKRKRKNPKESTEQVKT